MTRRICWELHSEQIADGIIQISYSRRTVRFIQRRRIGAILHTKLQDAAEKPLRRLQRLQRDHSGAMERFYARADGSV